jgi:hypothetical protein
VEPTDLIFEFPPKTNPAELLFGETVTVGDVQVTFAGALAAPTFSAVIGQPALATFAGALAAPTFSAHSEYKSMTSRPVVGVVVTSAQVATKTVGAGVHHSERSGSPKPSAATVGWVGAGGLQTGCAHAHQLGSPIVGRVQTSGGDASPLDALPNSSDWAVSTPIRVKTTSSSDEATHLRSSGRTMQQDMIRLARVRYGAGWSFATAYGFPHSERFAPASPLSFADESRFQAARPPNGGVWRDPEVPVYDPCYLPDPNLVFSTPWGEGSDLLFLCDRHPDVVDPEVPTTVVVPVRSVYIVLNNVTLRRVDGNVSLPTLSLSIGIDADSWTWNFSASLPAQALSDIEPVNGQPIELEASVNGNLYRVLAETISRERSFGSASIRVGGRGKSALLAAPYAPVMSFANTQQRTAQQLMVDVLKINGVSLGWDIDWGLTDWLVPEGVFAVQGSYIDGLNSIASAAGAYIQPHPTLDKFSVQLRYPVAPWQWGSVVPQYEIPSSVMTRESIEWQSKPAYNRVYVTGQQQGVMGRITRSGTAGDLLAPMVTDPLITHADAARQRGISVLGDTGRQAMVELSLPVLPETGVIHPGKFVRYTDNGVTRIGLTRSVQVQASGSTNLRQSIRLETHA